ncbi:MAG: hypothetical protein FWG81_10620 [Betaproteobacteria bacterium]|nr:hypothetical protein [Betaproteobacteria bacterium]
MTKILYRATSPRGVSQADYVEAETEKEAVAKLKAEGYTDIMLYESALTARLLAQERERCNYAVARTMGCVNRTMASKEDLSKTTPPRLAGGTKIKVLRGEMVLCVMMLLLQKE